MVSHERSHSPKDDQQKLPLMLWSLIILVLPAMGQDVTSTTQTNATTTNSRSFTTTPISTSVPMPTSALDASVPGQGVYPPLQSWCDAGANSTYCPDALLQDVELSGLYADSKTFPDKPTNGTLQNVLNAFAALTANATVAEMEMFAEQYFLGEGLELEQIPLMGFNATPAVLDDIADPIYKGWVSVVNSYWTLLIRQVNQSAVCNGTNCDSSFIALNNTIVVPGGRYREVYYWDTFWIMEGLLKSELYQYAWDVMQNFLDLVDVYGFVPNGGRKYYLDRSQPPVLTQIVDAYIKVTGNTTVLERALPILSTELMWWTTNRTISVTSPFTNKTYMVGHYNVTNSAPRPEGYVEDWTTAFGASPSLNESARADLYAELASGAETGWDYSARWCKVPVINTTDNDPALRTLNTRAIIPVDLNALLAGDHALLANLYQLYANSTAATSGNSTTTNSTTPTALNPSNISAMVSYHQAMSQNLSNAVLDLHWDPEKFWFYDYNMTSSSRSDLYTPAGTFALWQNITPTSVMNNDAAALQVVSGVRYLLGMYSGIPSVASLLFTGLNWDFPNSWPPHVSTFSDLTLPFDQVASGQLGLNETDLQPQPNATIGNNTLRNAAAANMPWPMALSVEYANRYASSAFCSWYDVSHDLGGNSQSSVSDDKLRPGGEIDGVLGQLPLSDLNSTGTYTAGQTGVMFEKFNATDIDAAGGGGEYTVQIGFGWTNGVVLWMAGEFGQYLSSPRCPMIPIMEISSSGNSSVYANGTTVSGGSSSNAMAGNSSMLFQGYKFPRS